MFLDGGFYLDFGRNCKGCRINVFFIVALGSLIVMFCAFQLDRVFPIENNFGIVPFVIHKVEVLNHPPNSTHFPTESVTPKYYHVTSHLW